MGTEPLSDAHGIGLLSARPAAAINGRYYYATDNQTLYRDSGTAWVSQGGGSALTVEEVDGSPTDPAITKIVFPNGTLTIVGHVATYAPASALTVEEVDGSPTGSPTKLVMPNGSLAYAGSVATYTPPPAGTTVNLGALVKIADFLLAADAATIDVFGIPANYDDLVGVLDDRGATGTVGQGFRMRLGTGGAIDAGSNYNWTRQYLGGSSGAVQGTGDTSAEIGSSAGADSTAGAFGRHEFSISDYTKIDRWRNWSGTGWYGGTDINVVNVFGGAWKNLAGAIDCMRLLPASGSFKAGTHFTLYGRGGTGATLLGMGLTKVAEQVLLADTASISFTGLPQTYDDLVIVYDVRSTNSATDNVRMRVGTGGVLDTGNNYGSFVTYGGTSSGNDNEANVASAFIGIIQGAGETAGYFSGGTVEILNYRAAHSRQWTVLMGMYGLTVAAYFAVGGGSWKNLVSPIDCLSLFPQLGASFKAGSKVSVYARGGPVTPITPGSTGARYPVQEAVAGNASTSSQVASFGSAPTNGNVIFLVSYNEGASNISSITQTGVTWSKVLESTASTSPHVELWKGIVGSGAGTSVTVAYSSGNYCGWHASEWSGVAGNLDQQASRTNSTNHNIPTITPTAVTALVISGASESTFGGGFDAGNPGPQYLRFPVAGANGIAAGYAFPGISTPLGAWPNSHGGTCSIVVASFT